MTITERNQKLFQLRKEPDAAKAGSMVGARDLAG